MILDKADIALYKSRVREERRMFRSTRAILDVVTRMEKKMSVESDAAKVAFAALSEKADEAIKLMNDFAASVVANVDDAQALKDLAGSMSAKADALAAAIAADAPKPVEPVPAPVVEPAPEPVLAE